LSVIRYFTIVAALNFSAAFCFVLLATTFTTPAWAESLTPMPDLSQAYVLRVYHGTGSKTVWSRQAANRLPPASLTKVMTALLVFENYQPDAVVTVSRRAASATGSRLKIKAGERYTVENLLLGALLASGNDACRALAEWRDGTEAKFVVRMNQRAAELGLKQTRFENACGHDAMGHYSSAEDLATLAEIALRHSVFADMVRRKEAQVKTVDGVRSLHVQNKNELIGRHANVIGVKSGYTSKAGKCLIALAERDGVRVLLVMLNAPNRWWDAHAALNNAFEYADQHKR